MTGDRVLNKREGKCHCKPLVKMLKEDFQVISGPLYFGFYGSLFTRGFYKIKII